MMAKCTKRAFAHAVRPLDTGSFFLLTCIHAGMQAAFMLAKTLPTTKIKKRKIHLIVMR